MAGLWEGLPASPCSAVSEETALRSISLADVMGQTKPPLVQDMRMKGMGTRSQSTSKSSLALPASVDVGFVDASTSRSDKETDFVAKLNFTAADERRKMLLQRLRAIDAKKAQLVASKGRAEEVSNSRRDLDAETEAATPESIDINDVEAGGTHAKNLSRKISNTSGIGAKPPQSEVPKITATPDLSLSLPENGPAESLDVDRFVNPCASPTATLTTICGSPTPSPSGRTSSNPELTHADLPTRTRSSRRVSRARTPSVLLSAMPGESCSSQIPSSVLKSKRYTFCRKVVSLLLKNSTSGPFSAPVRELWHIEAIPRYFDVISRPMDLGTVKKNIEGTTYIDTKESNSCKIFNVEAFAEDVRLVFRNAMVYNNQGDMLYNCAQDLLEEFEGMWKNLPVEDSPRDVISKKKKSGAVMKLNAHGKRTRASDIGGHIAETKSASTGPPARKRSSASLGKFTSGVNRKRISKNVPKACTKSAGKSMLDPLHSPQLSADAPITIKQVKTRLEYLQKCRVALRSREPLPKNATYVERADLIGDVPLTFSEKAAISEGIRKLPPAKLDTFLSIIHGTAGEERGDEIEVDINTLDTRTLRIIEAYLEVVVANFKTIRNSDVGLEFSGVEDFEDEEKGLLERMAQAKARPEGVARVTPAPKPFFNEKNEGLYPSSSDSSSESDGNASDSSESDSDSD